MKENMYLAFIELHLTLRPADSIRYVIGALIKIEVKGFAPIGILECWNSGMLGIGHRQI
jgi:hypothetical protein